MALAGITEPWLHLNANKSKAEELLGTLGNETGTFLVRKHKEPSKYVLSVGFKGKPTHHLGEVTPEGCVLNSKLIPGVASVTELIEKLKVDTVKGWPMKLTQYPAGGGQASTPASPSKSPRGKSNGSEISLTIVKGDAGGYGMTLANKGFGTFVVKAKSGGVAELAFKDAALSFKQGLRLKSVNGTDVFDKPKAASVNCMKGTDQIEILLVVDVAGYKSTMEAASTPTSPVKGQSSSPPPTTESPSKPDLPTSPPPQLELKPPQQQETPPPLLERAPSYEADHTTTPAALRPGPVQGYPLWLHENNLSRGKADAMLTASGAANGVFLVRRKADTQFAIDFVSSGRISHHLVKPHPSSQLLCVHDDEMLTAPTLNDIVAMLQHTSDHWPEALTTFVPYIRKENDPATFNLTEYIAAGPPPSKMEENIIEEAESKPMEGMITDGSAPSDAMYTTVMPDGPSVVEEGVRVATEDEIRAASRGVMADNKAHSPRREVLPAVEAARKELHDAVQVLSSVRQDKLHEAVAKYVNRKWSTSDLVIVIDQIVEPLDEEDRFNIVDALQRLLPTSQREAFSTMITRVKTEREFEQVIERTPLELHAELARLVTGVLKRVRGDTRRPEDISSFERRVQLASTQRGFAVVTMQGEKEDQPFVMEEIAKAVHVGWARSVISTWAPEYGMEPLGELIFTKSGALDTFNFTSVQGLQIYQQRVALANQRYVLPSDLDKSAQYQVPDAQKHLYRITAEILFDCYMKLHPKYDKREVLRQDRFAYIELKQLNLIGKPPLPKAMPPPQSVFARGGSLAGRGGGLNFKMSLPSLTNPADDGAGVDEAEEQQPPAWFYGLLDKNTAITLLTPEQNGTYLVRERPNLPGFALDFKFQNKVTHHLVDHSEDGSGLMLVGGVEVVHGAQSIADVVTGLHIPQNGWPSPLKRFVPRQGLPSKDVIETQKRLSAVFDAYSQTRVSTHQADDVDWSQSTGKVQGITFDVVLEKGGGALGMSLVGRGAADDKREGVFVTKVKPESTAAECGQITPGLRIMAINGNDLVSATKVEVTKYLKVQPGTKITLTFKDDRAGFTRFQQVTKTQRDDGSEPPAQEVYGVIKNFDSDSNLETSAPPEVPTREVDDVVAEGGNDPTPDIHLTLIKATSYGMTLLNIGFGNFVNKAKAGGVAASSFDSVGISVDEGIRIVAINDTNVLDQPKAACMAAMKGTQQIDLVVRKDPESWASTNAAREAKLQGKQSQQSNEPQQQQQLTATTTTTTASNVGASGDNITAADVGARVEIKGYECEGTLRFVGPHHINGSMKAGVELDQPLGKNNGTVKGHEYFRCEPQHGCMCSLTKVIIIADSGGGGGGGGGDGGVSAPTPADEVHVTFVKGGAPGYGCTLVGGAAWSFVGNIKPGGVAEAAFNALGVTVADGLRFVNINGVDVTSKADCAQQMKGTTKVDIVFKKDPAGHAKVVAAKKSSNKSQQPALPLDEVAVTITKGAGGFGMRLASVGEGTYVASMKPSSAAETACKQVGASASDGLRIKTVNGVDVYAAPKAAVVAQMKNVAEIAVVFKKDVAGWQAAIGGANPPTTSPTPTTTIATSSSSPTPGDSGGPDFNNMGRLAVIKHLRQSGIDYSAATNIDELRALAIASSSSSSTTTSTTTPTPTPTKSTAKPKKKKAAARQTEEVEAMYEVPAPATTKTTKTTKSETPASDIDNMGRLALIKLLRSKNIDYSSAKGIEDLRALAKGGASGGGGGGGGKINTTPSKVKKGKKVKIGTKWNTQHERGPATQLLTKAAVEGGFVVRPSARSSSGLSLSVFQQGKVANFNILLEGGFLKLASSTETFKKIDELISYYVQNDDGAFAQKLVVLPQFN